MSDNFEPHLRELCSDGACIGLIGPDGRCKECGKPGASVTRDPRLRDLTQAAASDHAGEEPSGEESSSEQPSSEESAAAAPAALVAEAADDIDARELCPDGTCVGVIGADGRCKECGTPSLSQRPG